MTVVDLDHLTKTFDSTVAVNDVTLRIESGEFMAVVGPTGCGKTTILRLVAGLETPTAGEVRFDNASMNGVDSSQRGVRMVFQNYALYPHLPVFRERGFSNLGFPLNLRRTRGAELTARIDAVAARAGVLRRLFPRKPAQLSSGEQQKVALGRALSLPPRVLLLDEPFSNLDAISRHRAQEELRSEHAKSRVTTLHVTHSLHEAFRLADRIAVMEAGRIVQVGTPEQLRDHPSCDVVKALLESSR